MDCSRASRGDVISLIARPSFESAIFSGPAAHNTFLRIKKVQGFGNIDSRMPVLLLEAAWPRLKRKSVGAAWPAEPPKRPSLRPWLGRFYLAIFCALKRCLALDGTRERAGHADVEARYRPISNRSSSRRMYRPYRRRKGTPSRRPTMYPTASPTIAPCVYRKLKLRRSGDEDGA